VLAKSPAGAPMRRPHPALPSTKAGECLPETAWHHRAASHGVMRAASSDVVRRLSARRSNSKCGAALIATIDAATSAP
jgi:hypothetical protein